MAAPLQQNDSDTTGRPSRATSCQLPVQPTGAARNSHRPSQSCDIESANAQACAHAKAASRSCYTGAKCDKDKPGYSPHAAVTLMSVFVTLIPVAFIAGYSTALLTGGSRACNTLSLASSIKGGGDGRQLSYDDDSLSHELRLSDSRHLASMEISDALVLPAAVPSLPSENMLFVTWIAFGEFGDGGFKTHNFHKVDMRWAEVARKSHPGCKIGLVLDQDTQLEDPSAVDFLHRLTIDKKVYGRNEYNDFYHWTARYSMLEKLQAEGQEHFNVVFMDPDIFVLDDLAEVFDHGGFDYATTISENPVQPINGAMHFVRGHHYGGAIDLLKGVLSSFQLKPEMGFTAGQQAYSDFFELTLREEHVKQLEYESVEQGVACKKIKDGDFSVCFVICTRYNFWEECTHHPEMTVEVDKAEDYAAVHVKVIHFIAYRKLGMQEVYEAFMEDGLEGAYAAWAALPHTEDGYKADPRFGDEA